MKTFLSLFLLIAGLSLAACAQSNSNNKVSNQTNTKSTTMDLSKISNEKVQMAIAALQDGDQKWYSFFTEKPVMTDDGNTIDFKSFFDKALGHEQFLTIDKVENDGMDVYGNFKAGSWGTFKVFFKFHQNSEGKFDKLDIGQARY